MTTTTTTTTATPAQRRWQTALIAAGLGVLGIGGLVLLLDVKPAAYLGILVWFAGAIIVHDAVVGPVIFGIAVLMRKSRRGTPIVVIAILQVAFVIAALTAALVLPAAVKKEVGSANPTILPLDYLGNLGGFTIVLAVLTMLVILGYVLAITIREKRRAPVDQD